MIWVFLACAAIRFLGLFPFVIDDDEAWWSVSARWLEKPWDFYLKMPDDKTPGCVWFDWLVGHLVPALGPDPRLVRAVFYLLTLLAALALGTLAETRFCGTQDPQQRSRTFWLTASLFLIATVLPSAKLLAYSSDGLVVLLVIFAYWAALCDPMRRNVQSLFLAGGLFGGALLVKQTAIFAALPILLSKAPKRWSWKELCWMTFGTLLVTVPAVIALGPSEMLYWVWTYPTSVLTLVRSQNFSSTSDFLGNLAVFSLSLLPILVGWMQWQKIHSLRSAKVGDFRILWLLSSLLGVVIGKGLFLHYFLLCVPPLVLMSSEVMVQLGLKTWQKLWLGIGYVACCFAVTIPALEISWGTDLPYYSSLADHLQTAIQPTDSVLLWSGSPLLLAYLKARPVTRFLIPRFAMEPYATAKTRQIFYDELSNDAPSVIIDLHERGDNRFSNTLESEPQIDFLVQGYHLFVAPNVPWAKLYFRTPPSPKSGLVEITSLEAKERVYSPYPSEKPAWEAFKPVLDKPLSWSLVKELMSLDQRLRNEHALKLLANQAGDLMIQERAQTLVQKLEKRELSTQEVENQTRMERAISRLLADAPASQRLPSLAMPAWWFTVSLAQMQPRTSVPLPRGPMPAKLSRE